MTSSFDKLWREMLSLGQPMVTYLLPGEGWLHGAVDAPHKVSTLGRFSDGTLAGEIDESTSDVVVYGIVRWRPLGRVTRRRLSTWNGRCA